MKKYTIYDLLIQLPKKFHEAKAELRDLLGIGAARLDNIIKAEIGSNVNLNAHQLGILAKYFKVKVRALYTDNYYKSLPTVRSLKKRQAAA